MLEAAWLLAAVELNGALVSKGAQVMLHPTRCAIESRVMAPLMQPRHHAAGIQGEAWVTDASRCSLDESEGVLRITLPHDMLAERKLSLGEPSGAMGIALLHDPALLAASPDYNAQPMPKAIPSAAFDVFLGSDLTGLGTVVASGPWSASVLHQKASHGASTTRAGSELFFADGGHFRVGDLRTDRGPEQIFGEFRGLSYASRASVLRSDGRAEAMLAVQSPSKIQFLDQHGMTVYSSEMLPPGNYRVQGFAASAVPGLLQAQLLDVNGAVQTVALPWTADRKLMTEGEHAWEVLAGWPRQLGSGLQSPPVIAAKMRSGVAPQLTLGASAEHAGDRQRASLEASSSALAGAIATAALGQSCSDHACLPTWLAEWRTSLGKKFFASASLQQTEDVIGNTARLRQAQLHFSGQLSPDVTASVHFAHNAQGAESSRNIGTLTASVRVSPTVSLQFQARHHLLATDTSPWSGFVGASFHFAKQATTVSTRATLSPQAGKTSPGLGIQAATGGGGIYGPQLSVGHTEDGRARSDAFLRYASMHGDASLRADTVSQRASWSASTRLWITEEGARLGPTGDDNLVIQKLGLPSVRMAHAGRDTQTTDAHGVAVFRKAPSWTDAVYAIDPTSIPFGVQLSASRIKVPLAANRAYVIDYRALWSQARSWRIADFSRLRGPITATDRHGRKVFIASDGYADLQSTDQLPLIMTASGQSALQCELGPHADPDALLAAEMVLQCAPHLAL